MPIFFRALAVGAVALASMQTSVASMAEDRDGNPIVEPAVVQKAPIRTAERTNPLGIKPVDGKALSANRGGAKVTNDMVLNGVVADNRVSDATTGHNVISDGAFSNSVGLPMVIQNSGNGVLIQNATIVNVQVK